MVMANPPPQANPSPQANPPPEADELRPCEAKHVGREFVRQYYTLMHEAPQHLHRFYSQKSCFVHGGVEKPGEENLPVCGQQEIHEKILALNFHDCHAKIRQVDSHPTLGSGVVVQVSGELSNNGEAMRRFMQTFVLAPKCAKRYFVLNDIFRYQDEVFPDEEEAEEAEGGEEVGSGNGASAEAPQNVQENKSMYFEQEGEPMSNGTVQEEEAEVTAVVVMEPPKAAEVPPLETDMDSLDIDGETNTMEKEPAEPEPSPEPKPEPAEAPKTCSWAAMASKNTNAAGASQSAPTFAPASHQVKPSRPVEAKPAEGSPLAAAPGSNPQPPRGPRAPREGRFERDRSNTSRGEEGEGDNFGGRRSGGGIGAKYPDSQQLFVGNLPHNISESELKVFFERWGKVVELRINTKSSGGKLPNFGFVVFDSPVPVQEVLQEKPIMFNGEHRLNVEEKKPRGSEGRPIGRGGPRGGGGGGPRGGFSGRGGMKNGSYGRPNDGERRGMGGSSRGGMSGPPRR
ncbi:ras GTPase-activating protein-binding protein 2-like isoform X2 [Babylonia areolata]|uniref:ras GTPase-activating protein-binding protein 2-like isoform X2 n=1 Tax=Babylonia areolata TaxID=304850 RepID=UPI003FD40EFF